MKKISNFIVLGDAISQKNGGSASFSELALSLKKVSNTSVATRFGKLDSFIYRHPRFHEFKKNIYNFPLNLSDNCFRKVPLKYQILSNILHNDIPTSLHQKCSLIIDCYGTNSQATKLHYNNDAKVIRMHNGSVKAFSHYFGRGSNLKDCNPLDRYKKMMLQYDGLIFQSHEQLIEAKQILGEKMPMVTIEPTINECALVDVPQSNFDSKKFRIVQIASIQPRKNQIAALAFLLQLRNLGIEATIRFLGSVEDHNYFQKMKDFEISNNLSGSVFYNGFEADYTKFYSETDCVIIPSLAEGVSRTLREALYLKKLVVINEFIGSKNFIKNKQAVSIKDLSFFKTHAHTVKSNFSQVVSNGRLLYDSVYNTENYPNRIMDKLNLF